MDLNLVVICGEVIGRHQGLPMAEDGTSVVELRIRTVTEGVGPTRTLVYVTMHYTAHPVGSRVWLTGSMQNGRVVAESITGLDPAAELELLT